MWHLTSHRVFPDVLRLWQASASLALNALYVYPGVVRTVNSQLSGKATGLLLKIILNYVTKVKVD